MLFSEIKVITVESPSFGQNAYIVHCDNSEACFIVDPGFDADRIVDIVKKRGLIPEAILVTHGHIDHIAGISEIREEWRECPIHIGREDADKLTDPNTNLSLHFGFPFHAPPADRVLDDGETIDICSMPIRVLHVPGHSRGQVAYVLLCEDGKMAFVGDIVFQGSVGRADFPDGDFDLLIKGIKGKLLTLPENTVFLPGHGPKTTAGDESRNNPYLTTSSGRE
ncbi:MAG TPA: MBL fold metallo-hydrolase [Planctomycetaceae bacterium]|nr:MBL fold metallo-hydrolase [Planctomycetaceae bacterium]